MRVLFFVESTGEEVEHDGVTTAPAIGDTIRMKVVCGCDGGHDFKVTDRHFILDGDGDAPYIWLNVEPETSELGRWSATPRL